MTDALTIAPGHVADVDLLEPLWLAVHHHHAATMPQLGPYVSDERTWAARSELYRRLLRRPEATLQLARAGTELVGYGLAYVLDGEEDWVADTWATGGRIGEVESLAVAPTHRGRGVGSRLLTALEDALAGAGVDDLVIGVLAGNSAALRLYERRGYQPTWLHMSRFAGRRAPGSSTPARTSARASSGPDAPGSAR